MRILFVWILLGLLYGCSDFLDEVDKDKLIPSRTEHYASVLLNCINYDYPVFGTVDYMADNLTEYSYATENSRKEYKPIYTWQIEIELDENGNTINNNGLWTKAYKNIAIANYVIEFVDDAEGEAVEKMFIKGEAYFLRALCYFNLLNIYGQPFNSESATRDLGVPLRLDNGIEQTYQRNSVADCYSRIEKDIIEAQRLIRESGVVKSNFHPSIGACALLLSRTYLYQQKWEEAVDAATEAMKYASLSRISTSGVFVTAENTEVLYSGQFFAGTLTHSAFEKGWQVNPELISLFGGSDLRLSCFFSKIQGKRGNVYYSNKGEKSYSSVGQCVFRLAEAYLTRAEAYVRMNKIDDAVADMKALLSTRYQRAADFDIPEDKGELLSYVLMERRKELCFEEHHRWFDLRRMEDTPTIFHTFTLTDEAGTVLGTQKYTLFPNDLNYTLPIPLQERENNPLIQNNERYEKLPETDGEIIIL